MVLPTYAALVAAGLRNAKRELQIRRASKSKPLGLIYLDVVGLGKIEEVHGRTACQRVLNALKTAITPVQREMGLCLVAQREMGDDFYLFIELPEAGDSVIDLHLYQTADMMRRLLENKVNDLVKPHIDQVGLYAGTALFPQSNDMTFKSNLYNAMKAASYQAKQATTIQDRFLAIEFQGILTQGTVRTFFQPIVSLATGESFGQEALLRGPEGSHFHSPENLFSFAQNANKLVQLEMLALATSIERFGEFHHGFKLFVNVDSRSILDPDFTLPCLLNAVEKSGLVPHDIVIEITERNFVSDYGLLNKVLDRYRNLGFSLAIDDTGMGYSSLQAITELMPDYIKIDKSLIRNVDTEMVKTVMLEALIDFAKKINCKIIAEGIETELELLKVIQLGIHYGQGYFLARPQPALAQASSHAKEVIRLGTASQPDISLETVDLKQLAHEVHTFDEETPVHAVIQYFNQHYSEQSVVIVKGTRPIGLVMRDNLFRSLATQYGVPLYWKREIRQLMDSNPLTVDSTVTIDIVSRLSMERAPEKVYDSIIVTDSEQLLGIITVQDILSTINTVQIERARESNPLTGLPGNLRIEREIRRRITNGTPFYLIYADIDYFKWFNDQYGFHRGDMVIRHVADTLIQVCLQTSGTPNFVGHIGGDDFIVITDNENPEDICKQIIATFENGIGQFYSGDGLADEFDGGTRPVVVLDRQGNRVSASGLSLSLSLLHCPQYVTTSLTMADITEQVGSLKKAAKANLGSTYVKGILSAANPLVSV